MSNIYFWKVKKYYLISNDLITSEDEISRDILV